MNCYGVHILLKQRGNDPQNVSSGGMGFLLFSVDEIYFNKFVGKSAETLVTISFQPSVLAVIESNRGFCAPELT